MLWVTIDEDCGVEEWRWSRVADNGTHYLTCRRQWHTLPLVLQTMAHTTSRYTWLPSG